jgi:hypothetical protein
MTRKSTVLLLMFLLHSGCIPGPPPGPHVEQKYWLVKDVYLAAGSTHKELFDHSVHETASLCFIPSNERNHYVAETKWYDPSGQEFRTIRQTYDLNAEQKKGEGRTKGGAIRIHAMSAAEMAKHKTGIWKVELYIDDELVRPLNFFVK